MDWFWWIKIQVREWIRISESWGAFGFFNEIRNNEFDGLLGILPWLQSWGCSDILDTSSSWFIFLLFPFTFLFQNQSIKRGSEIRSANGTIFSDFGPVLNA